MSASISATSVRETLEHLTDDEVAALYFDWQLLARNDQLPPATTRFGRPWRLWLLLGGRGAGKTRAGSEWIRARALGLAPAHGRPARRIAIVGETIGEARAVMVEGVSGLLAIHPAHERPTFEPSNHRLVWPNGSVAQIYSAENPQGLRGPQFDAAWCDEIAKWRNARQTWDMLQFGLRLGELPQAVATTTPRPTPLLKELITDDATVVARSATTDNAGNLAASFLDEMTRRYADTALGRQELLGEVLEDDCGTLWRRDWIEDQRVRSAPPLPRIVVAVDPPVTATANSDACGIVVAGTDGSGAAYVIADRTIQGREPNVWARAVIGAYQDHDADRVVAEVNQGGDLVVSILRQIDPAVIVRTVRATRGKWLRAEPIAALYAEGRIHHAGTFEALEDQMCAFGQDGRADGCSPDRLDALVWALSDLILHADAEPTIRAL